MRKFCYTIPLLLMSFVLSGQTKPVKILFDITSKDTLAHQTVVRHVSAMTTSYPDAQLEVVIYGGALPMVMTGKSSVAKGIAQLGGNNNVSFTVCAGTMKRYNVDKSQLLPGIVVVPDAIMEIVTKQGEGWGYIKETHN